MDEEADTRDDEHPGERERIDQQTKRHGQRADVGPRSEGAVNSLLCRRPVPDRPRDDRGDDERGEHHRIADERGRRARQVWPGERDDRRADEGQQEDRQRQRDEGVHQPLMIEMSSTSTSARWRKTMTTMASAIAASAAATVMTMNTTTWPDMSPKLRANAAKARLQAFHINSIAISIVMGLRRTRNPTRPMAKSAVARVR